MKINQLLSNSKPTQIRNRIYTGELPQSCKARPKNSKSKFVKHLERRRLRVSARSSNSLGGHTQL